MQQWAQFQDLLSQKRASQVLLCQVLLCQVLLCQKAGLDAVMEQVTQVRQ